MLVSAAVKMREREGASERKEETQSQSTENTQQKEVFLPQVEEKAYETENERERESERNICLTLVSCVTCVSSRNSLYVGKKRKLNIASLHLWLFTVFFLLLHLLFFLPSQHFLFPCRCPVSLLFFFPLLDVFSLLALVAPLLLLLLFPLLLLLLPRSPLHMWLKCGSFHFCKHTALIRSFHMLLL